MKVLRLRCKAGLRLFEHVVELGKLLDALFSEAVQERVLPYDDDLRQGLLEGRVVENYASDWQGGFYRLNLFVLNI